MPTLVALYPLSSPNHNSVIFLVSTTRLRYILFHHQTTTVDHSVPCRNGLRYILFHHQTTTYPIVSCREHVLRYILFHHQTTTIGTFFSKFSGCVISSFITKPQHKKLMEFQNSCCVISSFITKPQHCQRDGGISGVALYPLSSPNHNRGHSTLVPMQVALYPLSSPNHNLYLLV